ncbi:DUF1353 domain-containing protein [Rhizobium leguminosarum]|nr:DUF1353 domain-containing protein [Rhizobium leguminosarum]
MRFILRRRRDLIGKPTPIVPFADWDFYYTLQKLDWADKAEKTSSLKSVTVPKGFVTDLASIPRALWAILPRQALYTYPAIVHDFLYWFQPCTRDEADEILRLGMAQLGVSSATALAIFQSVRALGGGPWKTNAELRAAGERRILRKFPTDYTTTWSAWKQIPDVFA